MGALFCCCDTDTGVDEEKLNVALGQFPPNAKSFSGQAIPGSCYALIKNFKVWRVFRTRPEILVRLRKCFASGLQEPTAFMYHYPLDPYPAMWISVLPAEQVRAHGFYFPQEWEEAAPDSKDEEGFVVPAAATITPP